MSNFDVWLRPLSTTTCRVRVDGKENSIWLLARLSTAYVIKTGDAIRQETDSSVYTFDVLYPRHFSHLRLEELLDKIPPVSLRKRVNLTATRDEPALGPR